MAFRLVDHTADLAIEADGATQDAALEDAALAMTAVLTGRIGAHKAKPDREARFTVDAPDPASLVVAFLSELLWLHESQDLLWMGGGVRLSTLDDGTWRAQATGNALLHDPVEHGRGVEVKAVTYHGLRFERGADRRWHLWVLLDI